MSRPFRSRTPVSPSHRNGMGCWGGMRADVMMHHGRRSTFFEAYMLPERCHVVLSYRFDGHGFAAPNDGPGPVRSHQEAVAPARSFGSPTCVIFDAEMAARACACGTGAWATRLRRCDADRGTQNLETRGRHWHDPSRGFALRTNGGMAGEPK